MDQACAQWQRACPPAQPSPAQQRPSSDLSHYGSWSSKAGGADAGSVLQDHVVSSQHTTPHHAIMGDSDH